YYTPTLTNNQERWIGSCCGKSREFYLKQDVKTAKTIMTETSIALDNVYELMKQFEETAETRNRTGGVHQAAIATEEEMLAAFIDIGRHNALDKLYGYLLKEKTSLKNKIILFSGRVSSEIVLKVSKIGVGMIIAKSAPTDLALKLADDSNVSVIGFAKEASFNVYTNQTSVYEAEKNNHHPHNNIEESKITLHSLRCTCTFIKRQFRNPAHSRIMKKIKAQQTSQKMNATKTNHRSTRNMKNQLFLSSIHDEPFQTDNSFSTLTWTNLRS